MIDLIKARLVADWRLVARHAWSVRLLALAALFQGVEAAVPYVQGWLPLSPGWFLVLAFAATVASFVSRFVAQRQFESSPRQPRKA
ncbi:MAG: hypothetical protein GC182_08470 [Rhodopseudomonas sp.]|nr:hypothetical protein [Rhodopseudomonas sp.]